MGTQAPARRRLGTRFSPFFPAAAAGPGDAGFLAGGAAAHAAAGGRPGPAAAGAQAGAMSREIDGRQYLVAAVGGHGRMDTKLGDSVIAWALLPR